MPADAKGLVIVTGGSRGIGAAICRRLATDGYAVAVNYAADRAAADAVVAAITAAGGRAGAFGGDVSVEAEVAGLFTAAQAQLGPLHGLVNNAGILGGSSRLDGLTADNLARVLAVNVAGSVLCAREAVRTLSTRHGGKGGAIVNMGSIAARLGGAGELVHYAATKGAIDSFTVGLAREVAGEGHPRQRGGARPDRYGDELGRAAVPDRAQHPDRPRRPCRRDRRGGGVADFARSVLHDRHDHRSVGRTLRSNTSRASSRSRRHCPPSDSVGRRSGCRPVPPPPRCRRRRRRAD